MRLNFVKFWEIFPDKRQMFCDLLRSNYKNSLSNFCRYQWKKVDCDKDCAGPHNKTSLSGNLTFDPVRDNDEGRYQCIAKNQYGTAISDVTQLREAFLEPNPGSVNVSMEVREGNPLVIRTNSSVQGFPKPKYYWDVVDSRGYTISEVPISDRIQIDDDGRQN